MNEPSWVCIICERILTGRKDEISNGTPVTADSFGTDLPLSSYADDVNAESFNVSTASSYGFQEAAPPSHGDDADKDLFAC